jgi:hypothetical protein
MCADSPKPGPYISNIFCICILLFQMPSTSDEWKAIAHDFGTKFKFWNCIGAIHGKHIAIRNPAHAGSGCIPKSQRNYPKLRNKDCLWT